jgi:hypothetical protein
MRMRRMERTKPIVLRPFRKLLGYGVAARLSLTIPLAAVALWLTIPTGTWWIVIVGEASAVVLSCALTLAFLRTGIELGDAWVIERGLLGWERTTRASQIDTVWRVEVYQPGSHETLPNLFVVAADGRLLLRMRGQYWAEADMQRVTAVLGAKVRHEATPMSLRELAATAPRLLYWFERMSRGV